MKIILLRNRSAKKVVTAPKSNSQLTSRALFIVGKTPRLSVAELESVLNIKNAQFRLVETNYPAVLYQVSDIDWKTLQYRLGGTIKIALELGSIAAPTSDQIQPIVKNMSDVDTFGISVYAGSSAHIPDLLEICKTLKAGAGDDTFRRFVLPSRGEQALGSVVIKKQKLTEFILYKNLASTWQLFRTAAAQDVDDWSMREYGRPHTDPKRGMLPAKVARIMVNLALGQRLQTTNYEPTTLFDPFCGVGTILQEALLVSCNVVGSDISNSAIKMTRKNLAWTRKQYRPNQKVTLIHADATHVADKVGQKTIDAIVTEPHMGDLFERKDEIILYKSKPVTVNDIKNLLRGLEKLYIGALRNWQKVLIPHGIVVIIFPLISFKGQEYRVKKPVDTCENLGYTFVQGPFTYARPQAVVRREIYIFRKRLED